MRCPNCDYEFSGGSTCPYCKVDTVLFSKTVAISDALYNRGLAKAKNSDMTGAINSLLRSVEFNKNNISARNLIGLCYYEIGYIGDALKHWVISNSILKEKNPARRYIENVQKDERALEKFSGSVVMYNQALDYLEQKRSDDLAVIQLKKAVELNPKFVDAYNLLTLSYLIQRDKEKAVAAIDKALSLDIYNPVALNYFNQIAPSRQRALEPVVKQVVQKQVIQKPARAAIQPPEQKPQPQASPFSGRFTAKDNKLFGTNFRFAEIIALFIGVAVTALVIMAFYVPHVYLPHRIEAKDTEIAGMQTQIDTLTQQYQAANADFNQQLSDKNVSITNLQKQINSLQAQQNQAAVESNITDAETKLNAGDYQGAADALTTVDASALDDSLTARYAALQAGLLTQFLNAGIEAYEGGDFETAKPLLDQAQTYVTDASAEEDAAKAYYYAGLNSERLNAFDDAIRYFGVVIANYPGTNEIASATSQYNNLTASSTDSPQN
ncbi:MAG: tetratricopeptide repeat protein [Defluviitaleaceae bacterium]|nr:tetratricopeptide repeat protein [Defluviitaleaceae bacterium]